MIKRRELTEEYLKWRNEVLKKSDYRCSKCGGVRRLHAHHIKSWENFPELRFDVNNGITLCLKCHIEKHPFMVKFYPLRKRIKNKHKKKKEKKNNFKFIHKKKKHKKRRFVVHDQYADYRFSEDNPNPNWHS